MRTRLVLLLGSGILGLAAIAIVPDAPDEPPTEFAHADGDGDGALSAAELRLYVDDWLRDDSLPHERVFGELDANGDGAVARAEFDRLEAVVVQIMGPDYLVPDPVDPGVDYVPFRSLTDAIDDRATFGAVYHRHYDQLDADHDDWATLDLQTLPEAVAADRPAPPVRRQPVSPTLDLVRSSAIVAGTDGDFFAAGAVIVGADGLALTNHHVAAAASTGKLTAMTSDGVTHRVVEVLAGNEARDVALIRLEGTGFRPAPIATAAPATGAEIQLLHHSESRFYAYDRGVVNRYSMVGGQPWMEVSTDYSLGGSGCGLFDAHGRLVGLVASFAMGDGPGLTEGLFDDFGGEGADGEADDAPAGDVYYADMMKVRHAVPLTAIRSLWQDAAGSGK